MRFILVDRIVSLTPGVEITATRRVDHADDYLADHFPGFPVVPGVLLTEMMAQTAGKCLDAERRPRGKAMLAKILSASFRQWVRPGDEVELRATSDTLLPPKAKEFDITASTWHPWRACSGT